MSQASWQSRLGGRKAVNGFLVAIVAVVTWWPLGESRAGLYGIMMTFVITGLLGTSAAIALEDANKRRANPGG